MRKNWRGFPMLSPMTSITKGFWSHHTLCIWTYCLFPLAGQLIYGPINPLPVHVITFLDNIWGGVLRTFSFSLVISSICPKFLCFYLHLIIIIKLAEVNKCMLYLPKIFTPFLPKVLKTLLIMDVSISSLCSWAYFIGCRKNISSLTVLVYIN